MKRRTFLTRAGTALLCSVLPKGKASAAPQPQPPSSQMTALQSHSKLGPGSWLRGNLHTHSRQSDGRRSPQEVIDDYAKRGYDFLGFSDHDIWPSPEEMAKWDSRGMVLLPGVEVSRGGPHILHVGASRRLHHHPDRQGVLDEIAEDTGSFAVVCHPNFLVAVKPPDRFQAHNSFDQINKWTGYLGLEIYNGAISRLNGSPYATDIWDRLLTTGKRVWGFANDDSHRAEGDGGPIAGRPDHTPLMTSDMERGWNVVWAEKTPSSILDAFRAGRFYASSGVEILSIEVEGMTVRVRTRNAGRIAAIRETGRRFAQVDGPELEVQVPPDALYARFECWGDAEKSAWTQPFFPTLA